MEDASRKHAAPAPAREAALDQLQRIEETGAYVGFFSDEEQQTLDARDRRQATEYVAGVTRWRRWLDFVLAHFYRGRYDDMEPALRQVLRLGAYELLFSSTPPHAAINEAVELAKKRVRPEAAGLVNGILRNLNRQQENLPQPDTGDEAEDLAIRYSHPTWMVRRWINRLGRDEAEALLQWDNARPTYGLRINTWRLPSAAFRERATDEHVPWEASVYLDDFVRVDGLQPIMQASWLDDGLCAVQDEAAGLVVRLLDPQPGETVIDLCAAPGGKALYAATRMRNWGRLLAYDVHEGRLQLVRTGAQHHGLDIIETEAIDGRRLSQRPDPSQADRVLLDAPCSGLGVLAKRADLRWQRTPEELEELTALQDELLDAAAVLVRSGGLLVYSTCTIAPEENTERVAAFLQRHPEFYSEPASAFVPAELVTEEGYYAALPHRHGIDGAFGVRLRKAFIDQ